MRARLRAGSCNPARCAAQRHRLADEFERTKGGMLDRLRDAEMANLRVGEYLVDRVNRSCRYAGGVEPFDPLGAVPAQCDRFDCRVERLAVLRARPAAAVIGMRGQVGDVERATEPAEENEGGARLMLEDGVLDRYTVDAVYGMHNWPGLPAGQFAVRPGPMMAAFDIFEIAVAGRGAHAAMPHLGVDPVVAAAQIVGG